MNKYTVRFRYTKWHEWKKTYRWGQRTVKARDEQEAKAKISYIMDRESKTADSAHIVHTEAK